MEDNERLLRFWSTVHHNSKAALKLLTLTSFSYSDIESEELKAQVASLEAFVAYALKTCNHYFYVVNGEDYFEKKRQRDMEEARKHAASLPKLPTKRRK